MNRKISVIIPAHNAEKFIGSSIYSVLEQPIDKEKIEILVVENGSTDNTSAEVEKIMEKEACVKLLHSEKGVSNARNMGIENAQGEWLVFLDADDKILPQGMPVLFEDANDGTTDIFFYGHKNGEESRAICNEPFVAYCGSQIQDCKIEMLKNPTKYMQVWAKLIRREVVIANHISFNPALRLSEDSDFMLKCLQAAESVKLKQEIIYSYTVNQSSAMRTFDGNKINDYIAAMHETQKSIVEESDSVKHAFHSYVLMHMNIAMVRENFCLNNPAGFGEKYRNMKKIIQIDIFKDAIQATQAKSCLSLRMAPILCMKMHVFIGAAFIYTVRALQNDLKEKKER